MPQIGLLLGGIDFSDFFLVLKQEAKVADPDAPVRINSDCNWIDIDGGSFSDGYLSPFATAAWIAAYAKSRIYDLILDRRHVRRRLERPGSAPDG